MQKQNVGSLFNQFSLHIPGVVDHKIVHDDDEIFYHNLNKCSLIKTSAWRNSNNAAAGGVGILISEIVKKLLANVRPFDNNKQIMIAEFKRNLATTIIVHYSPVEGSPDAQERYNSLSGAINGIPKHNVLMVIGDFNGHLGKDSYVFIP